MARMYYDKDANLDVLKGKVVGIVGYGSQGHAQAQNLRDSGVDVCVSDVPGTPNYALAEEHGFTPVTAKELAEKAHVIQLLVPDELQAIVYKNDIAPAMKKGKTLVFSHGFNIHYGQILPPKDCDVIMVAPKGPGHLVRTIFVEGGGVPNLIAIHQDASGKAKEIALAYSKGIGGTRGGVIETTFREETETDLFGEQSVLCGGCTSLVKAGFEVLVEAGYQPEIAYFECLHELKLIVDLMYKKGMAGMRNSISNTAEYGDLTRGPDIITEDVKDVMRDILADIQDGSFAREWLLENQVNCPVLRARRRQEEEHPIETVGAQLRDMMSWLKD